MYRSTLLILITVFAISPAFAQEKGIFSAIEKGEYARTFALLQTNPSLVESRDKNGNTPLHLASRYGNRKIVELLISKGADVNGEGSLGETPLYVAGSSDEIGVVELLISKGARVKLTEFSYLATDIARERSPTRTASGRDKRIAKLIITEGVDIDAKDEGSSNTPLHLAAEEGASEVVEMLIEKKADINAKTFKDDNATRKKDRMAMFVNNTNFRGDTALHLSAQAPFDKRAFDESERNRYRTAEILIAKGANLNAKNDFDETPLNYAVASGFLSITRLLVERGSRLENGRLLLSRAKDQWVREYLLGVIDRMSDSLLSAVKDGNFFEVERLLDEGADVNAKSADDTSALMFAVSQNLVELAELLIHREANVNVRNWDGDTAFKIAQREKNIRLIEILKRAGAIP